MNIFVVRLGKYEVSKGFGCVWVLWSYPWQNGRVCHGNRLQRPKTFPNDDDDFFLS